MKYLILLPVLLALSCTTKKEINDTAHIEEWQTLFNGVDLDDWRVKIRGHDLNDNFGNTFYVEDSLLKVKYDAYDTFRNKFGHIFYKDRFSYYKLAVEYRFVGEQAVDGPGWATRNSGVMVHGQAPETMQKDQDFPISIEVQLLGGNGTDDRTTANLCTPGTHVEMKGKLITDHCVTSSSETYHGEQWVRAEVEVYGDSLIRHIVNGTAVLSYEKPQLGGGVVSGHDPEILIEGNLIEEGSISLQSESHPVHFRKVELMNLKGCMDKTAKNYKSYYVKSDPKACVY